MGPGDVLVLAACVVSGQVAAPGGEPLAGVEIREAATGRTLGASRDDGTFRVEVAGARRDAGAARQRSGYRFRAGEGRPGGTAANSQFSLRSGAGVLEAERGGDLYRFVVLFGSLEDVGRTTRDMRVLISASTCAGRRTWGWILR